MNDSPLPEAPAERPQEYVADVSFDAMGVSPELMRAITERGYTSPTPVQAKAYKPVIDGKDIIVRSKTGTGKTAAFGMPLIDRIPMGTREAKVLVLCPTRELAIQVSQEIESLAKYRDIRVTAIYGGASMKTQEDALDAGSAIIVGTPGRVYDHIRRGNLKLDKCAHAVLDEADEMLNQGFYEEVTRILDCLPKGRQVLLFSATVPEDIQRLIARYTTDAETLLLSGDVYTVDHIAHIRYDLSDNFPKPRNLLYMLEMEDPDNAIIFCNTRDDTELVTAVLNRNGFEAELLNGDLPQKERERVMGKVKRGEVAFMVATDIAARGIDISDLGHVINYSLPEDPAVYLHRVGRTGRIGKQGTALNLISGRELGSLSTLEKKYNIKFEKRAMPAPDEATKLWTDRHVRTIKEAASGSIFEGYLSLSNDLKKRPEADDIIAFLLKYFFTHQRMERVAAGDAPMQRSEREALAAKNGTGEQSSGGFSGGGRGGSRGGRDDRGGRRGDREERPRRGGDREERPRRGGRHDVPAIEVAATVPNGTPAVVKSDRALFEKSQPSEVTQTGVPAVAAPEKRASAPKKRLSDREIFEALQAGRPLPEVGDPTVGDSEPITEVSGEREHRPRRERSERPDGDRERRPRREREPEVPVAEGHARLWLNLGKADGVDEAGLSQALESLGAPGGKVARTELKGTFSYLHVAEGDVAAFEALAGKQVKEKAVKIERARR
jgi:ATP-dependent RNA helicase DeaD